MLEEWLLDKPVICGSRAIVVTWGDARGRHPAGTARPVNDIWIAACCLACDLPLATLSLKDFEDFAEHHGLRLFEP
jgi:predicted nucleic acid-binding protein